MTSGSMIVSSALALLVVVAVFAHYADAQRAKRYSGSDPGSVSDGNSAFDEAVRDYVYNLLMSRMPVEGESPMMVKRGPHGYLDFGVSRGASGAEAAKARLGLKLAHNPFGPGR